jgi:hypothetical protein
VFILLAVHGLAQLVIETGNVFISKSEALIAENHEGFARFGRREKTELGAVRSCQGRRFDQSARNTQRRMKSDLGKLAGIG